MCEVWVNYFLKHKDSVQPLKVINLQVNEKCPYTISRISDSRYALEVDNEEDYGIGLFVDVYPLDGVGNSKVKYSALKNKSSRYALQL